MVRDYIKIDEHDLVLAEDFFENDKHFSEWLLNVIRYYRGKNIEIKTKIVQKYFNNYKKTMDYIIISVGTGKKGAELKAELQRVRNLTLQGGLEPPLEHSLEPNIKDKSYNTKTINKKTIILPEVKKLRAELRTIFLDFYKLKFNTDYYWSAKDGSNLPKLINQIEFKIKELHPAKTDLDADIKKGFELIINAISDPWLLSNFSIPIINSKFNEIFTKIKTPQQNGTVRKNDPANSKYFNTGAISKATI